MANQFINSPDAFIAQKDGAGSSLENTLTPTPAPNVPHYTGLILLSLFTFVFLLFLLVKKQIKEIPYSTLVTVLLGVGLPILTIVQLTTDLIVQDPSPPAVTRPATSPTEADPTEADPTDTDPDPLFAVTEIRARDGEEAAAVGEMAEMAEMAEMGEMGDIEGIEGIEGIEEGIEGSMNGGREEPLNPSLSQNSPASPPAAAPSTTSTAADRPRDRTPRATAAPPVPIPPRSRPASPLDALNINLRPFQPSPNDYPSSAQTPASPRDLNIASPPPIRALLRQGDRGDDILTLQKILRDLDLYTGPLDGYFGYATVNAVKAFQRRHTLLSDGIVGFSTCEILNAQSPNFSLTCTQFPTP